MTIERRGTEMEIKEFADRLFALREAKGVSARDMSLSIGQNENYINNMENKKAFPSMTGFFYICEYLEITPSAFFNLSNPNPYKIQQIDKDLIKLNDNQLEHVAFIIKEMVKQN